MAFLAILLPVDCQRKVRSFKWLLKERCSPEMSVTFLYGQLAGNDSERQKNGSHAVKTYPLNQDCSDLSSFRLSDSVFVAVGN